MDSKHKPLSLALSLSLIALLSGCANSAATRNANVIGGGTLGAAIAHEASEGDAAWTIGGAAIGALTAVSVNEIAKQNERKAYRSGYEAALNQSVKQQYWIIQNRQKEDAFKQEPDGESFLPVVIPEQEIDGEITNERIIYVRTK